MFNQIRIPLNLVVENNAFLSVISRSPKYSSNALSSCIWLNEITFQPHHRDRIFSEYPNLKYIRKRANRNDDY